MNGTDPVVVVATGAANVASVCAALDRAGVDARLSAALSEIAAARRLVLPGVGAFGAVMARLDGLGLVELLRERVTTRRPTLAICLGLQVLADASEESPGVSGLGVIPATVRRFAPGLRVPQLGWNRVRAGDGCTLLTDGAAYFANSYRLQAIPDGWCGATADHGGEFVAALERGPVLGCQFHPELSGEWGQQLLGRWLAAAEVAAC